MEWYWWVLIIAGVIGIAILKVLYVPKWMKKQQEKKSARQTLADEDK